MSSSLIENPNPTINNSDFTDHKTYNYLNRRWNLWYHDPNNTDYTLASYIKLGCIDTIESFWHYYYQLKLPQLQNGMFFLMEESTKPTWEDNLDGGSWSYKIDKKDIAQAWTKLSIHLLSDNFIDQNPSSTLHDEVVGILISPKKTFSIFKVWIRDHSCKDNIKLNSEVPFINTDEALYRSHQETKEKEEMIHRENATKTY